TWPFLWDESQTQKMLRQRRTIGKGSMSPPPLKLQEVFVLSGPPSHTFVQPVEYTRLLVALQTAGRSIVIEGPSGIGKTTSIEKAIAQADLQDRVLKLSARKSDDAKFIGALSD